MSIDFSGLECVRGVDVCDAVRVISAYFAKRGLVPAEVENELAERVIHLAHENDWLVVLDSEPDSNEAWAEELSRALDATGVSLKAYPDFGSFEIRRFDSGDCTGALSVDESTRRARDGWYKAKLPFLADLAPPNARPQLRSGLAVGVLTDAMITGIARTVSLPEPRDKYTVPPATAKRVAFVTAAAKVAPRRPRPLGQRVEISPVPGWVLAARSDRTVPSPTDAELAELEAFADEMVATATEVVTDVENELRAADRERAEAQAKELADQRAAMPPLPGKPEGHFLDDYRGRAMCVGRVQWDGPYRDVEAVLFDVARQLGDAVLATYDDGDIDVDLTHVEDTVPVRVGGPLAPSTSAKGAKLWKKARVELARGGSLRLGGSLVHVTHAPYTSGSMADQYRRDLGYEPCPIVLGWELPAPNRSSGCAQLAVVVDAVIERCTRSKHLVEAIATPQQNGFDLAYARMAGVWSAIRKRGWFVDHIAGPAWRLYVPAAAAKKLSPAMPPAVTAEKVRHGMMLRATTPNPFAMTNEAMNALARYLLPAVGTKRELAALENRRR